MEVANEHYRSTADGIVQIRMTKSACGNPKTTVNEAARNCSYCCELGRRKYDMDFPKFHKETDLEGRKTWWIVFARTADYKIPTNLPQVSSVAIVYLHAVF